MAQAVTPSSVERMTPRRRVVSAVMGGRVDRVPVANPTSVATVALMDLAEAPFPDVHLDAEKMVRLAAACYEVLGFDTIMPLFSTMAESAALGADVDWAEKDNWPAARDPVLFDPRDFRMPSDFLERPSMRTALDAIRTLRKLYPDACIVGKTFGPWTIAYQLVGVEQFLIDVILDPDKVRAYLEVLVEPGIVSARAQVEAGADVILWGDHSTGDLVRAETYRDFLLPIHREVTRVLNCPLIYHCCGFTMDRMEYIVEAGWDCFHFDSRNDARQAKALVGRRMSLVGNINNPSTLLFGTPEDVRRETLYALEAGVDLVGPECAVPLVTPIENLQAIAETVRKWSATRERQ